MRTRARRPGTTDPWGLVPRFKDAQGVWRQISETTRAAVLASMGVDPRFPTALSRRGGGASASGPGFRV